MVGTELQIQLADQIREGIDRDFDRVASAFRATADRQGEAAQADTRGMIEILEDKRAEVMANNRAGYFISEWQELDGRVRDLIAQDPRYAAIKAKRESRRLEAAGSQS
jgi:hypothetical protein